MRKFTTLLCAMLFTIALYSQNADRLDSLQYWIWGPDHPQWMQHRREYYEYDVSGNLTRTLAQQPRQNEWLDWELTENYYDENNNLTYSLSQLWNLSEWENETQVNNSFDQNNNLISQSTQDWDQNMWLNHEKYEYTYDDQNHILSKIVSIGVGQDWQYSYQQIFNYDDQGNVEHKLTQYWNLGWEDNWRAAFTYNGANQVLQETGQAWSFGDWRNDYRDSYEYDENERVTTFTQQHSGGGSFWENHHRTLYSYGGSDHPVLVLDQYNLKDFWFDESRIYNTYDGHQNLVSATLQDKNGPWENIDSTHYYYTIVTDLKDHEQTKSVISVFPNPASSIIHIINSEDGNQNLDGFENVCLDLRIYTENGTQVFSIPNFKQGKPIDIGFLASGLYRISVRDGKSLFTKSFAKL
ncbi:MAG: T9SS type A sorting domain-containing protein [Saprospiraceae bacterium]